MCEINTGPVVRDQSVSDRFYCILTKENTVPAGPGPAIGNYKFVHWL